MRTLKQALPVWSGSLLAVAAVTLIVGYASLENDPYSDGDCFPWQSGRGTVSELVGVLAFAGIAYGTFALGRTHSKNWRAIVGVSAGIAVAWFAFVFWVFTPATHGLDLTHDWDGYPARTRWLMALGPIAALLLADGGLVAVNSSRLADRRWRYLLAVPFMLIATAGLLVAVVAPFFGTYCDSYFAGSSGSYGLGDILLRGIGLRGNY
jgi:hypothetical protein